MRAARSLHAALRPPALSRTFLVALALVTLQSCAFLSKSDPLTPRYFSLDTPRPAHTDPKLYPGVKLRLGSVGASSDIRQYLLYRTADHELSYSNELRWTERPEAYLKRSLEYALFEQRGVQRILSGPGITLEVELIAFEEVRQAPEHVRVSAVIKVHDGRLMKLEKTFSKEQPIPKVTDGDRPQTVAKLLAATMEGLVEEVVGEAIKLASAP